MAGTYPIPRWVPERWPWPRCAVMLAQRRRPRMTPANLVVRVETVGDDDPELVNELASDLYETLQESPADRIRRQRAESEAGSKGAALDWAALVVTFSGQLPQIVA